MVVNSCGEVSKLFRVEILEWQFDDLCQEVMNDINIDNRVTIQECPIPDNCDKRRSDK